MGSWWSLFGMCVATVGFYGTKGPFWSMPTMILTGLVGQSVSDFAGSAPLVSVAAATKATTLNAIASNPARRITHPLIFIFAGKAVGAVATMRQGS